MNVCNLERLAEIYKINIGDLFRWRYVDLHL
jgi:hypothetical protein